MKFFFMHCIIWDLMWDSSSFMRRRKPETTHRQRAVETDAISTAPLQSFGSLSNRGSPLFSCDIHNVQQPVGRLGVGIMMAVIVLSNQ